jgi:hypothetical protein
MRSSTRILNFYTENRTLLSQVQTPSLLSLLLLTLILKQVSKLRQIHLNELHAKIQSERQVMPLFLACSF